MKITLIGMGSGCPESLTVQGYAALREADLILGAPSAAVGPACWLHGEPCCRLPAG